MLQRIFLIVGGSIVLAIVGWNQFEQIYIRHKAASAVAKDNPFAPPPGCTADKIKFGDVQVSYERPSAFDKNQTKTLAAVDVTNACSAPIDLTVQFSFAFGDGRVVETDSKYSYNLAAGASAHLVVNRFVDSRVTKVSAKLTHLSRSRRP